MGFPTELFVAPVDANLICPVCLTVLKNPESLQCGHSFCSSCLKEGKVKNCPTCRCFVESRAHNFVLQGLIDNLLIHCRNNNSHENTDSSRRSGEPSTPPRQRRRMEKETCDWVGKLSDWHCHAKNECCLPVGICQVKGCGFVGSLKELEEHEKKNSTMHLQLMLKEQVGQFHKEIENTKKEMRQEHETLKREMKEKLESTKKDLETTKKELVTTQGELEKQKMVAIHMYLSSFCRSWILKKPDPLFDFVVYVENPFNSCHMTTKLLVGVPGPEGSIYEYGLYPVLMTWTDITKPPVCKLPKGFSHPNVTPDGTVKMNVLQKKGSFLNLFGVTDLFFALQHFLTHPNYLKNSWKAKCNLLSDFNNCDDYPQELASKYPTYDFFHRAIAAFDLRETNWCCIDDKKFQEKFYADVKYPKEAPLPPSRPIPNDKYLKSCKCISCAWASSYEGSDMICLQGRGISESSAPKSRF